MTRSAELSRAKRYNFCFPILILLCAITVKTVNAQSALPTVGNETFQAIAQFYAYDANITLDATVVSKQDLPAGSKEGIC